MNTLVLPCLLWLLCLVAQAAPPFKLIRDQTPSPGDQPGPSEAPKNPNKKLVNRLAKAGHMSTEEMEKVHSLLQTHRQSRHKELQAQREQLAKDPMHKGSRDRLARRKQAITNYRKAHNGSSEMEGEGPSIPKANRKVAKYLVQGDIRVSLKQAQQLVEGKGLGSPTAGIRKPQWWLNMANRGNKTEFLAKRRAGNKKKSKSKRQAINRDTEPDKKWEDGYMPFYMDETVTPTHRVLIEKAVDYWNKNTCLWLEEEAEDGGSDPRVVFNAPEAEEEEGCHSALGNSNNGDQLVVLSKEDCDTVGIASHEIAHALGFHHTQSRHDRSTYVKVFLINIKDDDEYNFDKENSTYNSNFGQPYDFGSVMHYRSNAFNINEDDQTIETIHPTNPDSWEYDNTIGSRLMGPSMTDYKVMNALYNCDSMCSTPKSCSRGGFQNPNQCTKCICPPGLGGDTCTTPVPQPQGYAPPTVDNHCDGGVITVGTSGTWTLMEKTIGDRLWDGQEDQDVAWCHWYLQTYSGYHLEIEVTKVGGLCGTGCGSSFTEIRVSDSTSPNYAKTGVHLCCPYDLEAQGGNSLELESVGVSALISSYTRKGRRSFSLKYRAVPN